MCFHVFHIEKNMLVATCMHGHQTPINTGLGWLLLQEAEEGTLVGIGYTRGLHYLGYIYYLKLGDKYMNVYYLYK